MERMALAGILAGAALMFPSDDVMGQEKHWPALELPKIACRGTEHCGRFVEDNPGWACHMPTLFITGKNPDIARHTPAEHIAWAKNPLHSYVADGTGALCVIAHPGRWQDELLATLKDLDGMEIAHGRDFVRDARWDRALTARLKKGLRPIWGFAADDTHSSKKSDRCWFAARLSELNEKNLKAALRGGNFYVSTGPVITDVQVQGGTITLKAGQKSDIRWLKSGQYCRGTRYGVEDGVVSRRAGANQCLKLDRGVTESSYTLNEADGTTDPVKGLFIRCVVSAGERAAMTQPFVISVTGVTNPYAPRGKWYKGQAHNHSDALPGQTDKIKTYHADYAARGHACAFETGYDYWVVPFQYYPPDRTPVIERVEPFRLAAGGPAAATVSGRAFKRGAKVLLNGQEIARAKPIGAGQIEFEVPPSLALGAHTVTVRNPDGFQDTRQYALVVQESLAVNDGWTHYTPHNTKLGSRYTYAVAADGADGVWVATNYGLNHFDGKVWKLHRKGQDGLAANTIYDLAVDEGGDVWFTCFRAAGVLRGGGKLEQWRSLDPEGRRKSRFPGKQVNQVLRAGGVTYVSIFNRHGLYALRGGKWMPVKMTVPGARKVEVLGLAADGKGRIWMGSPVGLIRWDPTKGDAGWKRYHKGNSPLSDDWVHRLAFDSTGTLWVGTATRQDGQVGGLVRYDGKTWRTYSPADSPLPERRIWSVFVDAKDNVWAATSKGAACLKSDGSWVIYDRVNSGLGDNLVTDICQDGAGDMWFATANGVSRLAARGK